MFIAAPETCLRRSEYPHLQQVSPRRKTFGLVRVKLNPLENPDLSIPDRNNFLDRFPEHELSTHTRLLTLCACKESVSQAENLPNVTSAL